MRTKMSVLALTIAVAGGFIFTRTENAPSSGFRDAVADSPAQEQFSAQWVKAVKRMYERRQYQPAKISELPKPALAQTEEDLRRTGQKSTISKASVQGKRVFLVHNYDTSGDEMSWVNIFDEAGAKVAFGAVVGSADGVFMWY